MKTVEMQSITTMKDVIKLNIGISIIHVKGRFQFEDDALDYYGNVKIPARKP